MSVEKAYPFIAPSKDAFLEALKNSVVPVPVVYATQTQTCKQLANQLARYLQLGQIKTQVFDIAALKPENVQAPLIIYMTCTFFMGEHPKSATQFVQKLRAQDPEWAAALKDKYFSIFGIGSQKYKLFCKASDEIDALFGAMGGIRIMRPSRIDRNLPQGHEPQFQEWMKDMLDNCGIDKIEDNSSIYETKIQSKYPLIAAPKGYFWARLIERTQLSDNVVDGIQHYYKFLLPQGRSYKAGQHIAIMPRNHRAVMNQLFKNQIIYLDEACTQVAEPEQLVKIDVLSQEGSNLPLSNDYYTVWDLVAQYTDLHAMVNQNCLGLLSAYARDEAQAKELKHLSETTQMEAFKEKFLSKATKIGDIFGAYHSLKVPLNRFLEIVPPMQHRLYSIASSPKLIGAQYLELIITDVTWEARNPVTGEKYTQRGCSTGFLYELSGFLGDMQANYFDRMGMFPAQIHESPLEPPKDPKVPLITLALGSGYAPFRSILQERLALKQQGVELGPMCLFLGLRRRADYGPILDELNLWCKNGIAYTYLAISRESETPADAQNIPMTRDKRPDTVKITYGGHITKSIVDNYEVFGEHMTAPNNLILYCGKAGKIPEDLTETIIKALGKYGIVEADAKKMWVQYLESGRIFFEAW